MVSNNCENELSGFLFSILYLLKDAEKGGLPHTKKAFYKTLDAFLQDCTDKNIDTKEFKIVIDLCLASVKLTPRECELFLEEIQKTSTGNNSL